MVLLSKILLFAPGVMGGPPLPPMPGGGPPGSCFPPPCIPINDHIWVLVLMALVYGAYKMYKYKTIKL